MRRICAASVFGYGDPIPHYQYTPAVEFGLSWADLDRHKAYFADGSPADELIRLDYEGQKAYITPGETEVGTHHITLAQCERKELSLIDFIVEEMLNTGPDFVSEVQTSFILAPGDKY